MHKNIFGFKPVTHLSTSPYRQIIGEKSYFTSIAPDSTPKKFLLKNSEYPKVWFKGGIKVKGINFVTGITNHPLTKHDSYIITDEASKKPIIEFYGSCKKYKKPIEIFNKYDINIKEKGDIIYYTGEKNLDIGDKISNLHGQKGTITHIVNNDRFEIIPERIESDIYNTEKTNYKKIDILMNFDSVIKRGAFGIFTEISYDNSKIQPDIYSPTLKLQTCKLYDSETDTYHECIIGNIHYMILDKLSSFIVNKKATIDRMAYYNLISNGDETLWKQLQLQRL